MRNTSLLPTAPDTVTIETLNHRGEGVARTPVGLVSLPYALPGEEVKCALDVDAGRGRTLSVISASSNRTQPYCRHFGHCGGCVAQHMTFLSYLEWKTSIVRDAFAAAGIHADVSACIDAHGRGRRRGTFHARRSSGRELTLGFSELRSHALVSIECCPVLVPELEEALPSLRAIAACLPAGVKSIDLAITATEGGLDLDIRGLGEPNEQQRLKLIRLADHFDYARLSVHGICLVERRPPVIHLGRVPVVPPCGGFLQATEAGQDALVALVKAAVGKARKVADLFAGTGTFALQLAESASVHAVEGDKGASAALDRARRHAKGIKPISVETRDLFRRPLLKHELDAFDTVVFDPPRAGAEAQCKQLSGSKVQRIIAVSCSPTTLARDVSLLVRGGYMLTKVVPVDQFRHSAHVEVVAVLEKNRN